MKRISTPIKSASTMFARVVIYLVAAAALIVLFILIPELVREEGVGKPFNLYLEYSFFAGVYVLSIPFFVALHQSLKLLDLIDGKKAFSLQSIKALGTIKICAIVFSVMMILATIAMVSVIRSINPGEDAPPFALLGFILTSVSVVVAVFIAVLQKLLIDAVKLKSENDLIV